MILTIKNYTKIINNKIILDNINLELKSGNIYGFYGRNGSGKTMLFRAIATFIYPTEGDIIIDDKSIINEDYDMRNFGILIDNSNFYSDLTGFENLDILYRINNKKDENMINDVLKKIGLYEEKDKKFKEYSLGMKQKLRIAQAIMENQKIIVLDEPTNGLDEKSIKKFHKLILELKEKNKIVLLASHNKDDLKLLCDKIYFLEEGKIKNKKGI